MIVLVAAAANEEVSQLADELGGPARVVLLTSQPPPRLTSGIPILDVDLMSAVGTSDVWRLLEETHGPAEALVVAPVPATTTGTRVADVSDGFWSSAMTGLTVAMHAARAAVGPMMRRGSGRIMFVTWRIDDPEGQVPLATVSGAINQLARALATELGRSGVTANAVSVAPGRLASVAPVVRFLGSAESGYLTAEVISVGGTNGASSRWNG